VTRPVLSSDVWPNGEAREDILLAWALGTTQPQGEALVPPYSCEMMVYRRPVRGAQVQIETRALGDIHIVELCDAQGPVTTVELSIGSSSAEPTTFDRLEDLAASMSPIQGKRPFIREAGIRGWLSDLNGISGHESVPADAYVRWTLDLLHSTLSDWGGPLQMPALTRLSLQCLTAFPMEVGGLAANVTAKLLARAGSSTLWKIAVDSHPGPWAELSAIVQLPQGWVDVIDRQSR
jgi:hypothetical protein